MSDQDKPTSGHNIQTPTQISDITSENIFKVDFDRLRVRVLFLCANLKKQDAIVNYLLRRGWDVVATELMAEALQFISSEKYDFVIISVTHPNPKIKHLPGLINHNYKTPCLIYGEGTDAKTISAIQTTKANYKLMGYISGPMIYRRIKQILQEILKKAEQLGDKINDKDGVIWRIVSTDDAARVKPDEVVKALQSLDIETVSKLLDAGEYDAKIKSQHKSDEPIRSIIHKGKGQPKQRLASEEYQPRGEKNKFWLTEDKEVDIAEGIRAFRKANHEYKLIEEQHTGRDVGYKITEINDDKEASKFSPHKSNEEEALISELLTKFSEDEILAILEGRKRGATADISATMSEEAIGSAEKALQKLVENAHEKVMQFGSSLKSFFGGMFNSDVEESKGEAQDRKQKSLEAKYKIVDSASSGVDESAEAESLNEPKFKLVNEEGISHESGNYKQLGNKQETKNLKILERLYRRKSKKIKSSTEIDFHQALKEIVQEVSAQPLPATKELVPVKIINVMAIRTLKNTGYIYFAAETADNTLYLAKKIIDLLQLVAIDNNRPFERGIESVIYDYEGDFFALNIEAPGFSIIEQTDKGRIALHFISDERALASVYKNIWKDFCVVDPQEIGCEQEVSFDVFTHLEKNNKILRVLAPANRFSETQVSRFKKNNVKLLVMKEDRAALEEHAFNNKVKALIKTKAKKKVA
jgi:hypothetical protein